MQEVTDVAGFEQYFDAVLALLERIRQQQTGPIREAAALVARAIAADGVVHTFGTGHSHLIAEEAFFRAGGLAAVNPIRDSRLMMLEGALASTAAEREEGLAADVLSRYEVRPGDAAILVSSSGRNAVPIEMALEMRDRGAGVIAITSMTQSRAASSRHRSGKRLFELADVVIDTGVPAGDALVAIPGIASSIGPGSTIAGAAIVNAILVEAVARLAADGHDVPVLRSANLDGTDEELARVLERYRGRVPALFGR